MAFVYNVRDDIYWFDTTTQLNADTEIVKGKTAKAAALDAPSTVYISNGATWILIAG